MLVSGRVIYILHSSYCILMTFNQKKLQTTCVHPKNISAWRLDFVKSSKIPWVVWMFFFFDPTVAHKMRKGGGWRVFHPIDLGQDPGGRPSIYITAAKLVDFWYLLKCRCHFGQKWHLKKSKGDTLMLKDDFISPNINHHHMNHPTLYHTREMMSSWYCWWLKSCTIKTLPTKNGRSYQPQLVSWISAINSISYWFYLVVGLVVRSNRNPQVDPRRILKLPWPFLGPTRC